jgi:hypothetical protein
MWQASPALSNVCKYGCSGAPFRVGSWPLSKPIGKAGKALPGTNTLAYYEHL